MRSLTVMITVLAMAFGGAAPALADHGGAVDGVWRATDPDGSHLQLSVTEHLNSSGYFTVELIDSRATGACDPPARVTAITTTALYHDGDKILYADFSDIRCFGRSVPVSEGFHAEWTVIADDSVMVDSEGIVWFHVQG